MGSADIAVCTRPPPEEWGLLYYGTGVILLLHVREHYVIRCFDIVRYEMIDAIIFSIYLF